LADFNLESIEFLERSPIFGQDDEILQPNGEVTAGNTIGTYASTVYLTYPQPAVPFELLSELRLSEDLKLDDNDLLLSSELLIEDGTSPPIIYQYNPSRFTDEQVTIPASTTPGQYYLIAKLDVSDVVVESDENNNEIIVPITIVPPLLGNGIDLELTMNQSIADPDQWSSYSVNLTLKNNGPDAATDVKVKFPKPDGVVYVGGNEFAADSGSFDLIGDQVWSLGILGPGIEVTMEVNYFLLQGEAPIAYAEVISANESDIDSTPNNGTPPYPNEDDEASSESSTPPNPIGDGCYFEKSYQDIPQQANGIGVTYVDELSNGNLILTGVTTGLPPALVYSVYQTEVTSDGTFVQNSIIGQIPDFKTSITREGYLDVDRSATLSDNLQVTYKQFNGNTFWQQNYTIAEATSIDIDGARPLNENGFIVSGVITKIGESENNFYPFYIELDDSGNEVGRLIGEILPAYGTVLFEYESETGFYFSQNMPSVTTLRIVKTDKNLNELYTKVAFEPFGVTLGNVQEDENGYTFFIWKIGVEPGTSAMSNFARVVTINPQGNGIFAFDVSLAYNSVFNHRILAQEDGVIATFNSGGIMKIVRLNAANELLYQKEYNHSVARVETQTNDGSLLFTGTKGQFLNPPSGPQANSLFLLKTNSLAEKMPACIQEKPDLTISNLTVPNAEAGELIDAFFDVNNIGDFAADREHAIRAYFSTDPNLDPLDDFLGEVPSSSILAGETRMDQSIGIVVPNVLTGVYYLILEIDVNNVIDESNEVNNTIFSTINVTNSTNEPEEYCEVESDFPWHEWFSQINLNYEVFWPSGKSVYSDFTQETPVVTLERGSDENYVFDITYSYFTFDAYIRYYVDFNQNGIFEESEGGSVSKNAIAPGNNVTAVRGATHNIPIEAKLGNTRARFIISRNPITSACDNVAFGEIEDYTVNIVDELPNTRLTLSSENYFKMFPNPVINELTIDVNDLPGVKNISIYNALGHLVISNDLNKDEFSEKILINTSELIDGSYVVHLTGDGFKPRAQVIVVQRLE